MKTKFPITEKFKTISPANVSIDRYRYMKPGEEEPNLGLPPDNGYFLTSNTQGDRSWAPAFPTPSPGTNKQVIFNNNGTLAGTTDLYYDTTDKRLGLGTISATAKLEIAETWNSAATTFTSLKQNITDTASAANSKLVDLQVNNVSKFSVTKSGIVTATEYIGKLTGNADTATALSAPIDISLAGEVSGSISFDGTANVTITTAPTIVTFNKLLTLSNVWIDTGISGTDLDTGTYILQLFANDVSVGGKNINEYYSGIVSWYAGSTAATVDSPSDEIALHRSGGSSDNSIYLRTYRSVLPNVVKLQILSTVATTGNATYTFKFRKFI